MDDIVKRILDRMAQVGYDQKSFASEIGISPVTITDWKTGKSKSYMKKINIIAAALASPLEWLVFGEGESSNLEKYRGRLSQLSSLPNQETGFDQISDVDKSKSDTINLSAESLVVARAYEQSDEKSRAMARLALGVDDLNTAH